MTSFGLYSALSYNTDSMIEGGSSFGSSLVENNSDIISGGVLGQSELVYQNDENLISRGSEVMEDVDQNSLERRQLRQELDDAHTKIFKLEDDKNKLEIERSRCEEEVQEYALRFAEIDNGPNSLSQGSAGPSIIPCSVIRDLKAKLEHTQAQLKEEDAKQKKKVKDLEMKNEVLLKEREETAWKLKDAVRKLDAERTRTSPGGRMNPVDKMIHVKLNETLRRYQMLLQDKEKAMKDASHYKEECAGMMEQVTRLENDMMLQKESSNKHKLLEKDKSRLEKDLNSLEKALELRNMDVEIGAKRCMMFEEKLLEKNAEWITQQSEWSTQQAAIEEEKQRMTTQIYELQENLDSVKQKHRIESVQSDEFSNRVHEILEQKDAIIQEEKEATLTLKEKLSRIKEEKQKLETDTKEICTGYKDAADNAWLSYAELDAKSKRDSEENEDLRKRCRNITARSDDLNKIIKTSEKEIADLNRRIQLVEQEKESMVATMLRLQSDKNTLEKEGKALKDELYAKQLAAEDYKDSFQKERASNKKLVLKKNQEMEDTIANLTENFNRERRKFGSKIGDLTRNNRELMERLNKLATTQCQNEFGENVM